MLKFGFFFSSNNWARNPGTSFVILTVGELTRLLKEDLLSALPLQTFVRVDMRKKALYEAVQLSEKFQANVKFLGLSRC